MNLARPILALALLALTGCATLERIHSAQWPTPRFDNFHAATIAQRDAYLRKTLAERPGWYVMTATGWSMQPYIVNRPQNRHVYEPVAPGRVWTRDDRGLVVCFTRQPVRYFTRDRWDSALRLDTLRDPARARVSHMIADVSADGRSLLLTATGPDTYDSDGWQPAYAVHGILRTVVTVPDGAR